jgi:hypothetical protein
MRLRSRRAAAIASISVAAAGTAAVAGVELWPRPAHLVVPIASGNDTIVVNSVHPARLEVTVTDQYGRPSSASAVRFRLISGTVELSPTGAVTCRRRDDAVVQATFAGLSRSFALRCRPVKSLEAPSWMGFLVGDSARDVSFIAHGLDGAPVTELRGSVTIEDRSIAELVGQKVRPKQPGRTFVEVRVGDRRAVIAVQVHHLVTSFVNQPRDEERLAMRVRLARGDTIEVPLPKAAFWVTYVPNNPGETPPTIELRGNGSCTTGNGVQAMRGVEGEYAKYCHSDDGARFSIAHGQTGADTVYGTLALELKR